MNTYIIIINYNGYKYTIDCVKSLRKQTFKKYKIIIVDNASTDNSIDELSRECPECILLESKENLGFSGGNNLALEYIFNKADANAVVFLNNDTELKEDCLEILLEGISDNMCICPQILFFENKNRINVAGGYFDYRTGSGHLTNRGKIYDKNDRQRREIKLANGCCMAATVNTLKRLGPWKEEFFMYREDDEYTLRMFSMGIKILYEPKALLWHKECMSTGGEKGANIRHYYLLRNRLYNIKEYRLGKFLLYKTIFASVVRYLQFYFFKEKKYEYVLMAIRDFKKGVTGKKFY